jgi:DNA-binding CsgD family transcriptional regulator
VTATVRRACAGRTGSRRKNRTEATSPITAHPASTVLAGTVSAGTVSAGTAPAGPGALTSPATDPIPDPQVLAASLGLTPREGEVLALIAEGLSNLEIAGRLVVSEATVKSHVNHLLAKIGVRGRAQAVSVAYQHGFTPPGPPG